MQQAQKFNRDQTPEANKANVDTPNLVSDNMQDVDWNADHWHLLTMGYIERHLVRFSMH